MNWITNLFTKNKRTNNQHENTLWSLATLVWICKHQVHIGFKILDHFATAENLEFKTAKLVKYASSESKGRTAILKPNYMNL
jgi:hypothetical protein